MTRLIALCGLFFAATAVATPVTVVDDAGRTVTLPRPAHRIVSLAPNITDALFAAGAGAYVVGTSRFSDHPDEAKKVPVVGDATMIDLERIVGLKPDIVVVWKSGNSAAQVEKLTRLGIPVFYSETTRLAQVASTTRQLGRLAGTDDIANRNARAFEAELDRLRTTFAGKKHLKVFFQIWDRPLMTVGRAQIIDDALVLCGGDNIFADLDQAAPTVGREAVLARNPDVILSGGGEGESLNAWKASSFLGAVKHDNVFAIDAPTLALPSPSILPGVATLCRALDDARTRAGR
ncbi:iron complex transport system substrate-binding protein [Luteibacter jiangsuensis]|uniref:Iron complex transport system substrate-binding protein n=1 Tax=Luteibacter jiangsuensis TaxID=637577 RepID=A0ABT9SVV9_9GAMM|nr:cobalamin-binding protein [Luteibacter jiangsuensis]MDQ0009122.1 iron complex transport system substrate-binding protein [Luteibacter jiangsuensis]